MHHIVQFIVALLVIAAAYRLGLLVLGLCAAAGKPLPKPPEKL